MTLCALSTTVIDGASPAIRALLQELKGRQSLNARAGGAVRDVLQAHFKSRSGEPHRGTWIPAEFPHLGFWARIAARTHLAYVTPDEAGVTITDPAFRQKLQGGDIGPKRGTTMLAIPAMAEAYLAGSPREGGAPSDLVVRKVWNERIQRWMLALISMHGATKLVHDRRKAHKGELREAFDAKRPAGVWYWLVRRVHQGPDPDALPDETTLQEGINVKVLEWMKSVEGKLAGVQAEIHAG